MSHQPLVVAKCLSLNSQKSLVMNLTGKLLAPFITMFISTQNPKLSRHIKWLLAQESSWFHNYFKSIMNAQICDIAFFGTHGEVMQSAVDIIYGKEIKLNNKHKHRVVWLLDKLGVKWCQDDPLEDSNTSQERRVQECKTIPQNVNAIEETSDSEKEREKTEVKSIEDGKAINIPQTTGSVKETATATDDDFYAILDKFTETSDEELSKIHHLIIGDDEN